MNEAIKIEARTRHVMHIFSCLCRVVNFTVESYDESNNTFTCKGDTSRIDMDLFNNLCTLIDPDIKVVFKK